MTQLLKQSNRSILSWPALNKTKLWAKSITITKTWLRRKSLVIYLIVYYGHISYASIYFDLFPLSGLTSLAKEQNVRKKNTYNPSLQKCQIIKISEEKKRNKFNTRFQKNSWFGSFVSILWRIILHHFCLIVFSVN